MDYYHAEFTRHTGNMKKTWQTIGTVMKKNNKKEQLPQHFLIEVLNKGSITDNSTAEIARTERPESYEKEEDSQKNS